MIKRLSAKFFILLLSVALISVPLASCSKTPYDYSLDDYISVADLQNIAVSDSEIKSVMNEKINEIIQNSATFEKAAGNPAEIGTLVDISYKCYDTQTFSNASSDSQIPPILTDDEFTLVLGQGKMPSEIENAIVGLYAGESTEISKFFSENEKTLNRFKSKNIIFNITLISVYEYMYPVYNDEFVSSISEHTTTAEYENVLYKQIKEDLVWQRLLSASNVITYPKNELDTYSMDFTQYYTNIATSRGISLEEYVARKFFMDLSDFYIKSNEYAKNKVKEEMLIYAFSRKHDISVSDSEYKTLAQKYVKQYGLKDIAELETKFSNSFVKHSVLMDKVLDYIGQNVVVTYD